MKTITLSCMLLIISAVVFCQDLNQTIKGRVTDNSSQMSLPGATVIVQGIQPVMGAITDMNGYFRIENVPIGRHSLLISYVGYNPEVMVGIMIGSGKETDVQVSMRESVNELNEVVVKSNTRKDRPIHSMAGISARSFTVEETRRYAGGMDDPGRMASSFAGVARGNMQDNAIVIRGNAPKGVLWRVEGVEVPNPNHFSGGNIAGGGFVNILSGHVLANSDFFTGAFPAEFGNALAGVFDMKLRTGNNQKQEYAFQVGLHGLDFSGEGPFVKDKGASYLFNYRYSTFGLLSVLGAIPGEQIPKYQDLTFKINLPTKGAGVFSLWGMGGIDRMTDAEETDPSKWVHNMDRYRNNWDEKFGALGLNNKFLLNSSTYINTSLVGSGNLRQLDQQIIDEHLVLHNDMDLNDNTGKITLSGYINKKFSARHTNRTGGNINALFYNLDLSGTRNETQGTYSNFVKENGHSYHLQLYSQSQVHFTERFWTNVGVHSEYFALNGSFTFDPRVGFNWDVSNNQTISMGYGKHSQLESLKIYFINYEENGNTFFPNKDLSFSKAHHFVIGYDWMIKENIRLKVEPYFQYLYDIPGVASSWVSLVNFKQDFTFSERLANNSTGKNMGVDITFERFLQNNFYYLLTASVFDSKYKADDNVWRNTAFNKGFVGNVLVGKEFLMGKNRNNILGMNVRLNMNGGGRTTPLLAEESNQAKRPVFDYSRAFESKDHFSNFLDLTITYRINKNGYSSVWALQVNNLLGTSQNREYVYNYGNQQVEMLQDTFVLPGISYKIEF